MLKQMPKSRRPEDRNLDSRCELSIPVMRVFVKFTTMTRDLVSEAYNAHPRECCIIHVKRTGCS